MSNPTYLVGINSSVPGGPLQQVLVLTTEITGGGTTVSVNGSPVANPDFNSATPAAPGGFTNIIWQVSGNSVSAYYATSGTTVPFGMVLSGTNTNALVVGTGGSLLATGTGTIETTELATTGSPVNISSSAPPTHAGQLLISQPGNTTAVWADPLVQGLFAPGTNVSTGNSGGLINPVLLGAQNPSNLLENLLLDASGNLFVNVANSPSVSVSGTVAVSSVSGTVNVSGTVAVSSVSGSVAVTGTFFQATQPVSGTVTADQGGSWSVAVNNFPATQPVSNAGTFAVQDATAEGYLSTLAGTVSAGAVNVSGTVAATQSGTWNIDTVTSITNPVAVTGSFFQATQPVSIAGTVTVDASGTTVPVNVQNSSIAVTGTFFQATQPVSGTVAVSSVSGTVAVTQST